MSTGHFYGKFSGMAMILVFPLLGGLIGCLHWLVTLKAISDLNHTFRITLQRAILTQTLSHYLSPVSSTVPLAPKCDQTAVGLIVNGPKQSLIVFRCIQPSTGDEQLQWSWL